MSGSGAAVRPMREHDLAAIAAIEARSYEFPWSQGIFADCLRAGYCCWTMMAAGTVAGYGILAVAADEAHLLNLCIDPDFRQRGLARKLLKRLLELANEHRAGIIFLEVRPSNLAAIALYETAGFRRVAVRRNYYPAREGREDAVVMTLRMDEAAALEAVESPGGLG